MLLSSIKKVGIIQPVVLLEGPSFLSRNRVQED